MGHFRSNRREWSPLQPPPFGLQVDLPSSKQFQVNTAEFSHQRHQFVIRSRALGNLFLVGLWNRVQAGITIIIGREVETFVAFAVGASAIRFAAFHGSGDQGGSYDVGQVEFGYRG